MSPVFDLTHALTLWRPVASAMVHGPKQIENRGWAPPMKFLDRRIWIHAGLRWDEPLADFVRARWPEVDQTPNPGGYIIGHARIAGWVWREKEPKVVGLATPDLIDSPWFIGPYGWLLTERTPLYRPVPAQGHQKLWLVDAATRARCRH
jgi:hypothetical protein